MRTIVRSGQFKRDVRRAEKRGHDMRKLRLVIDLLVGGAPLPVQFRDHPLRGEWAGYRDLHIAPDWLLLYRLTDDAVMLARTGTHADLFGT